MSSMFPHVHRSSPGSSLTHRRSNAVAADDGSPLGGEEQAPSPSAARAPSLSSAHAPSPSSSLPSSPLSSQSGGGYILKMDGIIPTCASIGFGTIFLVCAAVAWFVPHPVVDLKLSEKAAVAHAYRPVVLVTLAWNALYFCFLHGQSASAFWVHRELREKAARRVNRAEQPRSECCETPTRAPSQSLTCHANSNNSSPACSWGAPFESRTISHSPAELRDGQVRRRVEPSGSDLRDGPHRRQHARAEPALLAWVVDACAHRFAPLRLPPGLGVAAAEGVLPGGVCAAAQPAATSWDLVDLGGDVA